LGQREDVVFVQIAAIVAKFKEFAGERAMIFGAVHFDEKDGAFLAKEIFRTRKDSGLRAFDVAFDEVRLAVGIKEIIEGDSIDSNGVGGISLNGNVAEAAVGRDADIDAGEEHGGGFGPDGALDNPGLIKTVAGKILAEAGGNFGIGFEGKDAAKRANDA